MEITCKKQLMTTVHSTAQAGFGEGTNEHYDKARPSYPPAALAAIKSHLNTSPPFSVVELGSGTGIFTRALLAAPEFSNAISKLTAVEPSQGMRRVFSSLIDDPHVSTQDGVFDKTSIDSASADFLVVAQAWHWCPDFEAGMKEIARVLKPNGVAFFIWNLEDRDAAEWVRNIRTAYEQHENNSPQFRLGLWRATFGTETYKHLFEPQQELSYKHWIPTSEQGVVDRVQSKSYITQLSENEKDVLSARVRQAVRDDNEKLWLDKQLGTFQYPYKTTLVVMKKKDSSGGVLP